MLYAVLLFAQEDGKGQGQAPGGDPLMGMLVPMVLIMLAFFFILVLPARRRERAQREALFSALKKNDEVLTNAGIIGIVANIKDDEVTLKVDESSNVRLRILKSSIARILTKEAPKEGSPDTSVKAGSPPAK